MIAKQCTERESLPRNCFFLSNSMNGSRILILFPGTKSVQILLLKALFIDHNWLWLQFSVSHVKTLTKFLQTPQNSSNSLVLSPLPFFASSSLSLLVPSVLWERFYMGPLTLRHPLVFSVLTVYSASLSLKIISLKSWSHVLPSSVRHDNEYLPFWITRFLIRDFIIFLM